MPGEIASSSTRTLAPELEAIFAENGVPAKFILFLTTSNILTVAKFASAAATEEKVETRLIPASGIGDLTFGEEVAITAAWNSCRANMSGAASSSGGAQMKSRASHMPEGVEVMLRAKWRGLHAFPLMGSWLVNEDTMTKMYLGLSATEKSLHVPDIASMARRSDLTQKSAKGTLITEGLVEQVQISLDPCTTHPEFHLRMRAYLMTICYLNIANPEWFPFETALIVTDFMFEQVNMRPDGKRPTLACLSACYLATFGEYAKCLQNDGTPLDAWLKNKTNWQHLWKESISNFDPERSTATEVGNFSVPANLLSMVRTNSSLIRGLQGNFDKSFRNIQQTGGNNSQEGGDKDSGKNRRGFTRGKKGQGRGRGGAGAQQKGAFQKGGGKATDKARSVSTGGGGGAWKRRKGQ